MMKKIKSIKELQAEKTLIRRQQLELEDKLQSNWKALKDCLQPLNITRDTIGSILKHSLEKRIDEENMLKNSFRFADRAVQEFGSHFKK